ncbi:recombinase family protein [Microbacterium sp. JAI119]|uniref:recombinase family protein n=1 Tax=Microbacterium sp. JAI119 TaxID=2723062 RepID=UPI0015CC7CDB|nr:recombinase family protein [Microbacterium sp. JAI119]
MRVSTPKQLHTDSDVDVDGNSIATQRIETLRKVRELGASLAREFVEPGQSAQSIAKRPELQKLLQYVQDNPDVKYVVIYMRSRAFRNFTDAAITKRALLEKGVRLVSAKEEFGEGYMADAMEAITDIMNEVQVRMNGEDVALKMEHKVKQGGTVGRAKLGYLNVRKDFGAYFCR